MNKFFILLMILISSNAFCQVGGMSISPNGSPPDPSAMLDVSATNKGLLMPRITTGQRDSIAAPALGLLIYNTTDNCVEMYGFGNWQQVSCLCSGPPSAPSSITGNSNPCSAATNVTYSVGLVLNATSYTWTVPAGATIIAGQGTNSITINFGTTPGNITVTADNSCGTSTPGVLPVTMNAIPATPGAITGNPYPCANSTAQAYSIAADSGAMSYTWSVPSGSLVTAGQGTNSVLINFYSTPGNVAVTANNACGSSNASALPITMATTPATPGTITGDTSFNSNQTGVTFSIPPVTEASSYTWTVPGGDTITAGQGTDSVTITFGNANGNICVTADNCSGNSSPNCRTSINTCYTPGTQTFSFTGGQQTFTVPCGAPFVTITVYGAQGGSGNGSNGGYGGSASGTLVAPEGTVLYVFVGGQNGFNGGGQAGNASSYGGGESDVRMGGTSIGNWVIVAGGGGGGSEEGGVGGTGGGGGSCTNGAGGAGGTGPGSGGPGGPGTCTVGGTAGGSSNGYSGGGGGGGLTGGGAGSTSGGYGSSTANDGSQGQGGNYGYIGSQCNCGSTYAAGGGGGYYGGGGTSTACCSGGSGGGGSSWASSVMGNTVFSGGVQPGNGQVVISW